MTVGRAEARSLGAPVRGHGRSRHPASQGSGLASVETGQGVPPAAEGATGAFARNQGSPGVGRGGTDRSHAEGHVQVTRTPAPSAPDRGRVRNP